MNVEAAVGSVVRISSIPEGVNDGERVTFWSFRRGAKTVDGDEVKFASMFGDDAVSDDDGALVVDASVTGGAGASVVGVKVTEGLVVGDFVVGGVGSGGRVTVTHSPGTPGQKTGTSTGHSMSATSALGQVYLLGE